MRKKMMMLGFMVSWFAIFILVTAGYSHQPAKPLNLRQILEAPKPREAVGPLYEQCRYRSDWGERECWEVGKRCQYYGGGPGCWEPHRARPYEIAEPEIEICNDYGSGSPLCWEIHIVRGFRVEVSHHILRHPNFTREGLRGVLDNVSAYLKVLEDTLISSFLRFDLSEIHVFDFLRENAEIVLFLPVDEGFTAGLWYFASGPRANFGISMDTWKDAKGMLVSQDWKDLYGDESFEHAGMIFEPGLDTVLHELAHVLHFLLPNDFSAGFWAPEGYWVSFNSYTGYSNRCLRRAYERNVDRYRDVETFTPWHSRIRDDPTSGIRNDPYLTTDHLEYFAELSVLYLLGEDYHPYHRAGLFKHDPETFAVIEEAWGNPKKFCRWEDCNKPEKESDPLCEERLEDSLLCEWEGNCDEPGRAFDLFREKRLEGRLFR